MGYFKKTCKVCGKEFIAKQSNYKCCSAECKAINDRNNIEKYRAKPEVKEKNRKRSHQRFLTKIKKTAYCKICRKEIYEANANKQYHDSCVLKLAHDAKCSGCNSKHPDLKRASNFGFSAEEVRKGEI